MKDLSHVKVGDIVEARCASQCPWREGRVVEYKKGGGSSNAQIVVVPTYPPRKKLAFTTFVQPSTCRFPDGE